jgi:flagellar basal-body rod modification protein FlgD
MSSTSSVTSTTSTDTSSGFGLTTAAEQVLDRDDFLKLLVEQLKNQDPLEPQDNSDYVAELAQFSNLEQTQGINDRLDLLAIQSRGQSNAQATSLVGQTATVAGSTVTLSGNGTGTTVNFTASDKIAKATVTIEDSDGNTVRTIELGAKNAGLVSVQWDGKDSTGTAQTAGSYTVSVKAYDSEGNSVSVDQNTTSKVTGVSYETGYAVLELANGATAPVSDLVRIEAGTTET